LSGVESVVVGVVVARPTGAGVGVAEFDADGAVWGEDASPFTGEGEQCRQVCGRGRFGAELFRFVGVVGGEIAAQGEEWLYGGEVTTKSTLPSGISAIRSKTSPTTNLVPLIASPPLLIPPW
jgi:hypothetical protein